MKKILILIILLVMPIVLAKSVSVTLNEYDSYEKEGINITLMNIDKNKEKFIICVNAEKYIVTEAGITEQYFTIDVDDINRDNVELDIDIDCDDCGECVGYCNNKRCFTNEKYVPIVQDYNTEMEDVVEDEVNVGWYSIIIFIILFIVIIFIAYYVIKKKV